MIHLVTGIDNAVVAALLAMTSQLGASQKEFVLARQDDRARALRIAQLLVVSAAASGYSHMDAVRALARVDITLDDRGRPRLIDSLLEISVSHTCDSLAVALDPLRVGVDIETLRPRDDSVMRKLFSDAELDAVGCDVSFTHAWVRKEAYAKWTGRGLGEYLTDGRYDTRVESFESKELYIGIAGGSGQPALVDYEWHVARSGHLGLRRIGSARLS